jgi:N-acetylneuraminic acid mutarotase
LVLQDNGGNNLTVTGNGAFTFSNPIASGGVYSVTVFAEPAGHSCKVTSGSGTANANVTNVQVACDGEWKWMSGSSTVINDGTQSAVYGTMGVAAPSNTPGDRNTAVSWSDALGDLWLFGGFGYDSAGTYGELNDLWKFDPSLSTNGEWTWIGGSSTVVSSFVGQPGVYGTLGIAAPANIPGGRQEAVSWSDASGKLWLFGGVGEDSTGTGGTLNDLWEFDPKLGTDGEWAWISGSSTSGGTAGQPGVYGTLGVAASTNVPGGRWDAVSWRDTSDNLWLFGGYGFDSTGTYGRLNDLWEFDPNLSTHGEWTWESGSNTVPAAYGGQPGVYGTLGVAAPANIPGGRYAAVSWTDSIGDLWLFGGWGADSNDVFGDMNDLWKFDPKLGSNGEWTWMGGSSTITIVGHNGYNGPSGVYGTLGVAASANSPGGRTNAVSWTDASGNLWLFGGTGFDSTGTWGELNDLWEFNPSLGTNGEWAWKGGSSVVGSYGEGQSGVYGTLGMAAPTNIPGGRDSAVSWRDASGNLWLFGGNGIDSKGTGAWLNDLWEYNP